MTENSLQRPGQAWMDRMAAEEPTAREEWPAGAVFDPHEEGDSDANILYTDLLAGPDENHPDPAATPAPEGFDGGAR